jgi:preprotein translocase subunit SecG
MIFKTLHKELMIERHEPNSVSRIPSKLITRFVTRVTRRVPHMEQELLTLQEHMSSHPVFSGFTLVLCVCFVLFLLAIVLSVLLRKNTNYGYFNVSQQVFLRYRIADDFVYIAMKRHLCVESRLSALSAAILTSNGLIDRLVLCVCFVLFLLAIVLSVLLRFTDSDYPFQPGSHRLNRSINPLDVNIAALRADNLDSTHRWRFIAM